MSVLSAAIEILKKAGAPLHVKDLPSQMISEGLCSFPRSSVGTPAELRKGEGYTLSAQGQRAVSAGCMASVESL